MTLKPYREALALPGIRSLLLVAILARVPVMATSVVVTLHVVLELDRGYAAAGLVGTAITVGAAVGAPWLGRLVDRHGLRPVLALSTVAEAVFWTAAPVLPYPALLTVAFFGGLLTLPVFSVVRQSIAALTPVRQRRQAYALDAMSVELSFMVGPALGVLMATTVSPRVTMLAVGGGIVLAGLALFALNPPIRAHDEEPATPGQRIPRRQWLTSRLVTVLAASAAATLVLGGTDVSVVALLRDAGQLEWTGPVLTMWGVYSLIGGFAYGLVTRPISPLLLLAGLGLCTIPVGLAGGQWWLLCLTLVAAGALCAPTLTATADAMSRLVPPSVRGEAMGLHGSAMTVGLAIGAPLAGAVIDATGPAWGFAATGGLGAAVAVVAFVLAPGRAGRHDEAVAPAATAEPALATAQPDA
jgi:predicted MFS family arabinose efflux permease